MSTFSDFARISFTKFTIRKKRFIFTIVGVSAGIAMLAMGFALLDGGVRYARKQALASLRPREFKEIRIFPQDQFMSAIVMNPRAQTPVYLQQRRANILTKEDVRAINNLLPFSIVSPYLIVSVNRISPPKYATEDIQEDPDFASYYGSETIASRTDIVLAKDAQDLSLANFTYRDLKYLGDRTKKLTSLTIAGASREWMESYPNVSFGDDTNAMPLLLSSQSALALLGIAKTYNELPYDGRLLMEKLSQEDAQKVQGMIGQTAYIF
ncbi:MAG: hypothetical protein UW24_C0018G0037, partial [Parcubacteria group bacterium GW2011_GWA2_44_12]